MEKKEKKNEFNNFENISRNSGQFDRGSFLSIQEEEKFQSKLKKKIIRKSNSLENNLNIIFIFFL